MGLLGSFQLAALFAGQRWIFVSVARWHGLGLWLDKDQYRGNGDGGGISDGVGVLLVVC